MKTWFLASLLVAAAIPLVPSTADACSQPQALYLNENFESAPIDNIPLAGVVPILAEARLTELSSDAISAVTIVVSAAGAVTVPGTTELTENRLIWRADAPLSADETYTMVIDLGELYGGEQTATFIARDATPSPQVTMGDSFFFESVRSVDTVCCDALEDSCGGLSECYGRSYEFPRSVRITYENTANQERFFSYSVDSTGDTSFERDNSATVLFPASTDDACVTLIATSLVDGSTTTLDEECVTAAELDEIDRSQYLTIDEVSGDDCEGDFVDPETREPIPNPPGASSGGCSASGGAGGGVAGLFFLFALVAIRRKRA